MKRLYLSIVLKHFQENEQMLFLVGPRQVGKTTIAVEAKKHFTESSYFTWDSVRDRMLILEGQHFIEKIHPINKIRNNKPLIIFDEIHKYRDWKNWLKGFYDLYQSYFHILVTGSARLDIYKIGSDSLMGRYFLCRVHPLSVREIIDQSIGKQDINEPKELEGQQFKHLFEFGGFPQVFLKSNKQFSHKWHTLRNKLLFYEDIKDMANIQEVGQMEVLAELLKEQIGQLVNRTSLAKKIRVSVPTISRWLETLERFYYCFSITPWHKNVSRSLIKEPKIYLWDWSIISDIGKRFENYIATHLLKSIDLWNDLGVGKYGLYYLRNKDKREVDFLVTKNDKPWILVEVKNSANNSLSKNLIFFKKELNAPYAFEVLNTEEYVKTSCFVKEGIWMVPVKTFLSQLV